MGEEKVYGKAHEETKKRLRDLPYLRPSPGQLRSSDPDERQE